VLTDPWDPPASIPAHSLGQLTALSFLADGLMVTAAQFCQALEQLKALRHLQLSRLQLTTTAAHMLAQAMGELPHLAHLQLSGGAAPTPAQDLYALLNGEGHVRLCSCPRAAHRFC
jgi:hypothetical protein